MYANFLDTPNNAFLWEKFYVFEVAEKRSKINTQAGKFFCVCNGLECSKLSSQEDVCRLRRKQSGWDGFVIIFHFLMLLSEAVIQAANMNER